MLDQTISAWLSEGHVAESLARLGFAPPNAPRSEGGVKSEHEREAAYLGREIVARDQDSQLRPVTRGRLRGCCL